MTNEEADQISNPTWVIPGLVPEGHVVAIVAKPNGGKTTILFHIACEIAKTRKVIYIHADTNPSDAKRMLSIARQHGVRYLTPDMKVGKGMRDVIKRLRELAASDTDLSQQVWIFDTLKKMANVIQKESLKDILALMRKLSARGMTCILLCHTNKYRNSEGQYQYEGTADLESDCDELIYFEPRENPDKTLTVSTRCAKRRANITSITWDVHSDLTVTKRDEYVDIAAEVSKQERQEHDRPIIDAVTKALSQGPMKQKEVVAYCHKLKFSEKRVRKVLATYSNKIWNAQKLPEKNAWRYELLAVSRAP